MSSQRSTAHLLVSFQKKRKTHTNANTGSIAVAVAAAAVATANHMVYCIAVGQSVFPYVFVYVNRKHNRVFCSHGVTHSMAQTRTIYYTLLACDCACCRTLVLNIRIETFNFEFVRCNLQLVS